jgi:hypothetical protein
VAKVREDSNIGAGASSSPPEGEKRKGDCILTPEEQERFARARKRKEAKLEQARARAQAEPRQELERLYELVGKETVLLPAAPRKKHPHLPGWQNITLAQSLKEGFQAELRWAADQGNVCARLGEPSNDLLTFDLDTDDPVLAQTVYEALCKSFEWVSQTLTTQGKPNRRQIWFRAIGDYPRNKEKLLIKTVDGTVVGELRNGEGDQLQSVLKGIHPDTFKRYRFLIEKPAIKIPFPFEGWPSEIVVNWNHTGTEEEKPADHPPGWDEASEDGDGPPQSRGGSKDQWWLNYPGCNFFHLDLVGLLRALKVPLKKVPGKEGWFSLPCPWKVEHTTTDGERDAVIIPPDKEKGVWWSFNCFHAHCAGRRLQEILEWAEAKKPGLVQTFCQLPELVLPSGKIPYPDCARKLWQGLSLTKQFFVRDQMIVEIVRGCVLKDKKTHDALRLLDAAAFRSRIDEHFKTKAWRVDKSKNSELRDSRCTNDAATVLLKTNEAFEHLPAIRGLYSCPVLAGEQGKLKILYRGYHEECGGIYVTGGTEEIKIPPLTEAVGIFEELLCDYLWVTPSDKARAVASFISPAIKAGGLLGEADFPIDVAEADQSQSGKTYRQKLVCACYSVVPYLITQRTGGVGSLDESFSSAILSGVPFILIDNFRGRVNSQILESALRGHGHVNVRVPHKGEMQLPTGYLNWMLSSNGIEGGKDFAYRTIVTGIRKHAEGYKFKEYPGGRDILGVVKANQKRYLGAIFSVLMEWDRAGRLQTKEVRHEFREWAGALDWIVKEVFKLPPLIDGHAEEVDRMSDPVLSWLRLVTIWVEREKKTGSGFSSGDIVDLCETHGVNVPGTKEGAVYSSFDLKMLTGKALNKAFGVGDEVKIGNIKVRRSGVKDAKGNLVPFYTFDFILS